MRSFKYVMILALSVILKNSNKAVQKQISEILSHKINYYDNSYAVVQNSPLCRKQFFLKMKKDFIAIHIMHS